MTSLTDLREVVDVVIGVDTHVRTHSAAVVGYAPGHLGTWAPGRLAAWPPEIARIASSVLDEALDGGAGGRPAPCGGCGLPWSAQVVVLPVDVGCLHALLAQALLKGIDHRLRTA
jgi:hypothetical protein